MNTLELNTANYSLNANPKDKLGYRLMGCFNIRYLRKLFLVQLILMA